MPKFAKIFFAIFKIAVSTLLLTLLFTGFENKAEVFAVYRQSKTAWLALGLAVFFVGLCLNVLRWKFILRVLGLHFAYAKLLKISLAALFCNFFF